MTEQLEMKLPRSLRLVEDFIDVKLSGAAAGTPRADLSGKCAEHCLTQRGVH